MLQPPFPAPFFRFILDVIVVPMYFVQEQINNNAIESDMFIRRHNMLH